MTIRTRTCGAGGVLLGLGIAWASGCQVIGNFEDFPTRASTTDAGAGGTHGAGGSQSSAGAQPDQPADAGAGGENGGEPAMPGQPETWRDPTTGLTWQTTPFATHSENMGLQSCGDYRGDGVHDWRLPNIDELRSLVRNCAATEVGGECPVSEQCIASSTCLTPACDGCPDAGCTLPAGLGGDCGPHWSTTRVSDEARHRYALDFTTGEVFLEESITNLTARCVRGP